MTTNNDNEFFGFSLFNDVLNPSIRAWNRANTIYNIKERHGNSVATKYVKLLPKSEQLSVYTVMVLVAKEGYENIRREIFRNEVNHVAA